MCGMFWIRMDVCALMLLLQLSACIYVLLCMYSSTPIHRLVEYAWAQI